MCDTFLISNLNISRCRPTVASKQRTTTRRVVSGKSLELQFDLSLQEQISRLYEQPETTKLVRSFLMLANKEAFLRGNNNSSEAPYVAGVQEL